MKRNLTCHHCTNIVTSKNFQFVSCTARLSVSCTARLRSIFTDVVLFDTFRYLVSFIGLMYLSKLFLRKFSTSESDLASTKYSLNCNFSTFYVGDSTFSAEMYSLKLYVLDILKHWVAFLSWDNFTKIIIFYILS